MAFFEQRVSEARLSKDGVCFVRTVKLGNRVLGHIEVAKLKPGECLPAGIYWGSAEVMRESPDSRAIHVTRAVITGLRMYGVVFLGCRFPDGRSYTMPLEICATLLPEPGKPYSVAPKALWVETLPPLEERVAKVMGIMRVAGRSRKSSMTASL